MNIHHNLADEATTWGHQTNPLNTNGEPDDNTFFGSTASKKNFNVRGKSQRPAGDQDTSSAGIQIGSSPYKDVRTTVKK